MSTLVQRVAARYVVRRAAREACSDFRRHRHAGLRDLTPEVLEAFGQSFVGGLSRREVTAGLVLRKLKNLTRIFTKIPTLWTMLKERFMSDFPDAPEVRGLRDVPALVMWLPKVLNHIIMRGTKLMGRALAELFQHLPLSLFTAGKNRLLGVNDLLNQVLLFLKEHSPSAFRNLSGKIGVFVKSRVLPGLKDWAEENLPTFLGAGSKALARLGKLLNHPVVLWYVYWFIWSNVAEFEWDAQALARAAAGDLTFRDLWESLPGSALGLVIAKVFAPGTFTLLPYVIAARLLYCLGARYLEWSDGALLPDWSRMEESLGLSPGVLRLRFAA